MSHVWSDESGKPVPSGVDGASMWRVRRCFALLPWVVLFALATESAVAQQVVINELMARNSSTVADEDGDYPDWIELHNAGDVPAELGGMRLSDDSADPAKWVFPTRTLAAGDHLLLFASGKNRAGFDGVWHTLVAPGATWRYLVPSQQPSSTWTQPFFDDSSWSQGPSGFGYGDNDDTTVLGTTMSVFIRHSFDIADTAAIDAAVLHMDYDDGFVAFLNGVEIARANMDLAGALPAWNAGADQVTEPRSVRGLAPERFVLDLGSAPLRPGTNVLAIQAHNVSLSSSDLTVIPYLTLGYGYGAPPRPTVPLEIRDALDIPVHTNFRLAGDGEQIHLYTAIGSHLDSIRFGALPADVSLGRLPDGGPDWKYFTVATPGGSNGGPTFDGTAPPVQFSPPGGVHRGSVSLDLSSELAGAPIHCTLDGTVPTGLSPLCTGTLSLSGINVVRARVLQPGLLPGPVSTHTYLNTTHTLPVVSVVAEPNDLWDYNTGIYVMGPNAQSEFPHFGANFWQDWEVAANVELYELDGAKRLNSPAGIQIMGGWSRGYAQKSLSVYARQQYGAGEFTYPVFPDRPFTTYENFVLRNSGNDWISTMLRDAYLQQLVRGSAVDWQAYRPAVMYLNGEYWGIHNLREKINEHYVAAIAGAPADEIDLLEWDTDIPAHLNPGVLHGDKTRYTELMDLVTGSDMTLDATYRQAESLMDVENYIDYYVTQIFVGNTDWPGNNVKYWRHRSPSGKWRWILYDLDFGFGIWDVNSYTHNTLAFAAEPNGPSWPNPPGSTLLFRRLLLSPQFRVAFINRFCDFLNVHFAHDRMDSVLESLRANIQPEVQQHLDRWGQSHANWDNQLARMSIYGDNRVGAVVGHLRSFFSLGPRLPITVRTEPEGAGSVLVNREIVSDSPWTGSYFTGVPLTVKALAKPGYRFAGWSGGATGTSDVHTFSPAAPVELVANFEAATLPNVFINEIHYHPAATSPSGDWIELVNTGGTADLSGWVVEDGAGNRFVFPGGTTIAAGEYRVVAEDPVSFSLVYPGVSDVLGGWTFGLSNAGELVRLLDAGETVMDEVLYDDASPWPEAADGLGPSLELRSVLLENADPANWGASIPDGGTPGQPNSVWVGVAPGDAPGLADAVGPGFPNPVGSAAFIPYTVSRPGHVRLAVFNVLGQEVARLQDSHVPAGSHQAVWRTDGLPAGLYVVRLVVDDRAGAQTVILRAN